MVPRSPGRLSVSWYKASARVFDDDAWMFFVIVPKRFSCTVPGNSLGFSRPKAFSRNVDRGLVNDSVFRATPMNINETCTSLGAGRYVPAVRKDVLAFANRERTPFFLRSCMICDLERQRT